MAHPRQTLGQWTRPKQRPDWKLTRYGRCRTIRRCGRAARALRTSPPQFGFELEVRHPSRSSSEMLTIAEADRLAARIRRRTMRTKSKWTTWNPSVAGRTGIHRFGDARDGFLDPLSRHGGVAGYLHRGGRRASRRHALPDASSIQLERNASQGPGLPHEREQRALPGHARARLRGVRHRTSLTPLGWLLRSRTGDCASRYGLGSFRGALPQARSHPKANLVPFCPLEYQTTVTRPVVRKCRGW